MAEQWRKLFNEEMESVMVGDLNALHEEKFLEQVNYVAKNSPLSFREVCSFITAQTFFFN